MKNKLLKKLSAMEYLIGTNKELFTDGIDEELKDIIKETRTIIQNKTIPIQQENLIEFDNIIQENKYSITPLFIYYNLKVNDNLVFDIENCGMNVISEIHDLISFIYETYMIDKEHTDLSYICDKAVEHKNEILNKKWNKYDLLKSCYLND